MSELSVLVRVGVLSDDVAVDDELDGVAVVVQRRLVEVVPRALLRLGGGGGDQLALPDGADLVLGGGGGAAHGVLLGRVGAGAGCPGRWGDQAGVDAKAASASA